MDRSFLFVITVTCMVILSCLTNFTLCNYIVNNDTHDSFGSDGAVESPAHNVEDDIFKANQSLSNGTIQNKKLEKFYKTSTVKTIPTTAFIPIKIPSFRHPLERKAKHFSDSKSPLFNDSVQVSEKKLMSSEIKFDQGSEKFIKSQLKVINAEENIENNVQSPTQFISISTETDEYRSSETYGNENSANDAKAINKQIEAGENSTILYVPTKSYEDKIVIEVLRNSTPMTILTPEVDLNKITEDVTLSSSITNEKFNSSYNKTLDEATTIILSKSKNFNDTNHSVPDKNQIFPINILRLNISQDAKISTMPSTKNLKSNNSLEKNKTQTDELKSEEIKESENKKSEVFPSAHHYYSVPEKSLTQKSLEANKYPTGAIPVQSGSGDIKKLKNISSRNLKEIFHNKNDGFPKQFETCSNSVPFYKRIKNNNTYETRMYPALSWLSVNVMTNNRILAELEATDKLRKYFAGQNEKGVRMNWTCPVLTQIKFKGMHAPREKIFEYAVSFYFPSNKSGDVPLPDDSEILVDIDEERTVFVKPFRARVWEITDLFLQTEVKKMFSTLRNKGEAFLSDYFYLASYTKDPTAVSYSEYELWAYATRSKVHQDIGTFQYQATSEPLNAVTRRTRSRVCKGLECPRFEVLSVHKSGIQKRRYYGARFATYYPDFCSFTKGSIWKAFMPLHLYKHGVNSNFEVIGATRPAGILHVREKKELSDIPCNQTFSVSIYLPNRFHAVPPAAGLTMPQIKITELDDVIMYVQSVGGFLLSPERIYKEISLFRLKLQQQRLCFKENEYYIVVYDYITRFHGRLNEIWIVAELCSDSL